MCKSRFVKDYEHAAKFLSFAGWNIKGLGDDNSLFGEKLQNQDFLDHIKKNDVNIITETWCKNPQNLQLHGYTIISSKA